MKRLFSLTPYHVFAAFLLLLVGVTLVSYRNTQDILHGGQALSVVRADVDKFNDLVISLLEAESSERAYLLTGDETKFREAYRIAESTLIVKQYEIRRGQYDVIDKKLVERLDKLTENKIAGLRHGIDDRLMGIQNPGSLVDAQVGNGSAREIQQIVAQLLDHERARLNDRIIRTEDIARYIFAGIVLVLFFATILVAVATILIHRHSTRREAAERESAIAQEKTDVWAKALEDTTKDARFINAFSDALGIAISSEEVSETISEHFQNLIPEALGTLALLNNSQNLLETVWTWNSPAHESVFAPGDCRALRGGVAYQHKIGSPKLSCVHIADGKAKNYLCIPLMAQGETLGVLHLDLGKAAWEERQRKLAFKMAGYIAMRIANLKLRDKLKSQAIRDPLTGVFNRRYMEESLDRELSRAVRRGNQVGVIMVDLDHFKRFNDTFGHDAGDRVLKEVTTVISNSFRSEDIVCRYGGEELLVIVPEMNKEEVVVRAEYVREQIRKIRIQNRDQILEGITASFGVAAYPNDAKTQIELLNNADVALYQAKHAGRDRVVAFGDQSQTQILEIQL